jgi:hypothetical protein
MCSTVRCYLILRVCLHYNSLRDEGEQSSVLPKAGRQRAR